MFYIFILLDKYFIFVKKCKIIPVSLSTKIFIIEKIIIRQTKILEKVKTIVKYFVFK